MPANHPEINAAARAALERGAVIEAIKIVREAQGIGLKDAKDAVDAYVRSEPLLARRLAARQAQARAGCLRALAILALLFLAGALLYFR